jgi:hypothetical protein
MSNTATIMEELQDDDVQSSSEPIQDLLQAIQDTNYTQAERHFNDIVGDRLQDTLDQAKSRIASSLGSDPEDDDDLEIDEDDLEFDDEDLDFDDEEEEDL